MTRNYKNHVELAKNKLAAMEQEIAVLKEQNKTLSKLKDVHYSKTRKILERAYTDAKSILVLAFSDLPHSKNFCMSVGISERKYYWAVGLLMQSNVMRFNSKRLVPDNINDCLQLLEIGYQSLVDNDSALDILRDWLPAKMHTSYNTRFKWRRG